MMSWKGCRSLILRYYLGICLEGLRKITDISQDSRSQGRNLNTGPPEYEAGVLTTRPQRSVSSGPQFALIISVCYNSIYFRSLAFHVMISEIFNLF
jgi:hypothetical protein